LFHDALCSVSTTLAIICGQNNELALLFQYPHRVCECKPTIYILQVGEKVVCFAKKRKYLVSCMVRWDLLVCEWQGGICVEK